MITSTANQNIKRILQLKQKVKARKEEGVFVVEGVKMFVEIPDGKCKEIYVSESFCGKEEHKRLLEEQSYQLVSNEVFAKISDTVTPQGILCVVEQFDYQLEALFQKETPLLLYLEDLQDPGNLGTIIRAGEGAGVDGIIMTEDTVDIYNPKVIRSTMGSIFRMPFLIESDLLGVMRLCKEKGVISYAAHLDATYSYDQADWKKGSLLLIGNEGKGLSKDAENWAAEKILIPMAGEVESLNAAIATAVIIYEARRQRRG